MACDHAAVGNKKVVIDAFADLGVQVEDLGADGSESVDYPDYAAKVAGAVSRGEAATGVLLCGTGIGMSIAANKFPGVRAALAHDVTTARMARAHNDANVLVLGGGLLGERAIVDIIEAWVQTPFEGGRHQRRVDKINALDKPEGGSK